MQKVKWTLLVLFFMTLSPICASAQGERAVKGDCTPDLTDESATTRGVRRKLPSINQNWDSTKVYRQMVILVSFRDCDFKSEDPQADFDSLFNVNGYNKRNGPGCVAEYFREQSGGLFNMYFDVYGPVKLDTAACPYDNPTENTRNYGREQMRNATEQVLKEHPDLDYSQYDWNGDGSIEQVIYINAGLCGNQGSGSFGYIWPNTGSFTTIRTPDGLRISNYTVSGELWKNKTSCGIGTICHEFTHSLGLPDIYPTTSSAGYSVADEWDLMDGGNFTNYGWCPPNYTPMEKMLLGWVTPIELTKPTSVRNLKSVSEGGEIYRVRHSDNEWYLLENRQHSGWDYGIPGKGLVVYHVYYEKSVWSGNTVNNDPKKRRFELVHADNMDYDDWDKLIGDSYYYTASPRLHSRFLSTSPYPWTTDSTTFVNNELTDNSVPAAVMNYPNAAGNILLSKPITNIQMTDDGLVSFDFMGGDPDAIVTQSFSPDRHHTYYDLQGRQVSGVPRKGIYIVRSAALDQGSQEGRLQGKNGKKIIIH